MTSDQRPHGRARAVEAQHSAHIPVVALGASAGGITALRSFFESVPPDTGFAFVVIMHLSPDHRSDLVHVLQTRTELPVSQVTERVPIEPNHVYVIPPKKRLLVVDHELSVADFEEPRGHRAPVDLFFRSLARVAGDGAAIILSGSGTDGSVGIKDVKEAGGLILVQDPDEAEYDSMPRSAIATDLVDVVLPVRELAVQLVELKQRWARLLGDIAELGDGEAQGLRQVLALIRARTGHDFSSYKGSTVMRRIRRRMQVTEKSGIEAYLEHLRRDEEEGKLLFKDLLIGVTSFFRDPEAFESLAETVLPKLFEDRGPDDSVRVWVVGCASGEEAYSLAILLEEYAQMLDVRPKIQIFATDIDEQALASAREGLYPQGVGADVSQERLDRFFAREGDRYRIRRSIRELVLFAPHSVIRDAPFSRLDLVSCRNLLIYMQPELQERALDVFHYALQPGGYLFLGTSETAGNDPKRFRVVDKRSRLYQVEKRTGDPPRLLGTVPTTGAERPYAGAPRAAPESEGQVHRRSLEEYGPPSVLVNERRRVVHLSERVGRYLELPGGPLTADLTKLVRPELQGEVGWGLHRALEREEATVARPVRVRLQGEARTVYLSVRPAPRSSGGERRALVIFDEADENTEATLEGDGGGEDRAGKDDVARLQGELDDSRRRLQATVENFETAREELQAQNEELRSVNEEYKSTMEELETSREELQSLNEELQTVNSELKNKVEEISRAHADVENLIAATEIGTLFLDRELRIKRYTQHAKEHFNLRKSDHDRPISDLNHRLRYEGLESDARRALRELESIEREVEDDGGRWYLMRLRPYRTVDDRIDGVVLTLVEISQVKRMEESERASRAYAESIVNSVRDGVLVLDEALRVKTASKSFYETFRVTPRETESRLVYELGNGQWNIPELRRLLEEVLPEKKVIDDFQVTHAFEGIGNRTMLINGRKLDDHHLILLVIRDVTEGGRGVEARSGNGDPPEEA